MTALSRQQQPRRRGAGIARPYSSAASAASTSASASAALLLMGLLATMAVPASAQLEEITDPSAVTGFIGSAYTPGRGGLGGAAVGAAGAAAGLASSGLGLSADPGKGNVGSGGLLSIGAKAVLALLKGLGVPPALALFVVRSLARNSNVVATVADALTPLNLLPGSDAANSWLINPAALLNTASGAGGGAGGLPVGGVAGQAAPQDGVAGVRQLTDGAVGRITASLINILFPRVPTALTPAALGAASTLLGAGGSGLTAPITTAISSIGIGGVGKSGGGALAQSASDIGGVGSAALGALAGGLPLFGYFQLPTTNWAGQQQQSAGSSGRDGNAGGSNNSTNSGGRGNAIGGGRWTAGAGLAPVGSATARDWQGFQGQLLSDMAAQTQAARRQLDAQAAALQDLMTNANGTANGTSNNTSSNGTNGSNTTGGSSSGMWGAYDAARRDRANTQYEQMLDQVCSQWGLSRFFSGLSSTLALSNSPFSQLYDSYARLYGQTFQGLGSTGQQYLDRMCCDLLNTQQDGGTGYSAGDFVARRWGGGGVGGGVGSVARSGKTKTAAAASGGTGGSSSGVGEAQNQTQAQAQQQCDPRMWLARALGATIGNGNSNGARGSSSGDGNAIGGLNGSGSGNGSTSSDGANLFQQVQSMQQAYQDWNNQVIQSVPGLSAQGRLAQDVGTLLGQRLGQQWATGSSTTDGANGGGSSISSGAGGIQQQQALQQAWEDWQRWVQGRGGSGDVTQQSQQQEGGGGSVGGGLTQQLLQTRAAQLFSSAAAAAPPSGTGSGGGRRQLRSAGVV